MELKHRYAWKPDIPDHRDHYFSLRATAALPTFVDRIGTANPIEDQGNLGSCTGCSSTSALEIAIRSSQLSKLMAYYDGRAIEGTVKEDSGCMIRDVIKGLMSQGVAPESLWPYNIAKFAKRPSSAAYRAAKQVIPLVASYQRVTDLVGVKTALAAGLPVIFGFSAPDYLESQDVATSGWLRVPTAKDPIIGGHAVVAVGYDDRPTGTSPTDQKFIWVRNSWSAQWGIEGYFKMDQGWFANIGQLVDDMWMIHPK